MIPDRPPNLIDTHCHLTLGDLAPEADQAWSRAQNAGVRDAIVVGIDATSSEGVVEFTAARDGLHACVGLHPNEVARASPGDWERIVALTSSRPVVALGESGFDLYWKDSTQKEQLLSLNRHAELALETGLPLVLHLRDAFPEAREHLAPFAPRGLRAVIHCFTGGGADLQPFLDWGFMISFSGILTYPKAEALREAAALVPLDQCLVETDSPWLPPEPYRGQRNEPAHVVHVARRLAEIHGLPLVEVARITTHNARRFFALGESDIEEAAQ